MLTGIFHNKYPGWFGLLYSLAGEGFLIFNEVKEV